MSIATQTSLPNPPIAILGVPFDNVTMDETLELIPRMIESRRPHHLVTADADFLVQSQDDLELRRILFESHLVLCDGAPLLWASKLLGNPLPGGVAGTDIAPLIVRIAAERGHRLFLLGATPESTQRAIASLRQQHPQLIVAGHYSPPFKQLIEMTHDEVLRHIAAARPDILLVALGALKQEKWIAMHYRTLGVPVNIGVGATFDFLIAPARKISAWRQRPWVRWFFRLWKSPRLPPLRMLKDCWVFGTGLFVQRWRLRTREHEIWKRSVSSRRHSEINWQSIRLPESLDVMTAREDLLLVDQPFADGRHCLLEADGVEFIDSTGVGLLIGLQKRIRATGRQLVLLAPSEPMMQALDMMRLGNFFDSAPDVAAAQRLIELRAKERAAAVTPGDAAPGSPLLWHGEITAANAEAVWELTQIHLAKLGTRRSLTIDMGAVRFVDSSGAGIMVRARKFAQQHGIQLKFINVQPAVVSVLNVMHLEEFLLR